MRPTARRSLPSKGYGGLCFATYAGPEAQLPDRLEKNAIRPTVLLGDGRTDLSSTARLVGRSRWHVPHAAELLLHRDSVYREGLGKARRQWPKKQGADLVFEVASPSERRQAIARWVRAMRHVAPRTARYLPNAAEGLAEWTPIQKRLSSRRPPPSSEKCTKGAVFGFGVFLFFRLPKGGPRPALRGREK